jgi:hypothetical protein
MQSSTFSSFLIPHLTGGIGYLDNLIYRRNSIYFEREKYPTGLVIYGNFALTSYLNIMSFFKYHKVPSFHLVHVLNDVCEYEITLVRQAVIETGLSVDDSTVVPPFSTLPRNMSHPAWKKLSETKSNAFWVSINSIDLRFVQELSL